ncbi:histidine kinase N-terminal 7TM domain-containing protein [Haloarculaceae archaeon H-GB11]|nr:histidine kinase N-terminal 7TM domain-containing protein [Haloarculaceae archaeon H-GB11]
MSFDPSSYGESYMWGVFEIITLVGTCISLALAYFGWQARPKPGATPLVVVTLAIALWNGTVFLAALSPSVEAARFWVQLHFVGLTLIVPGLVALVLEYGGREDLLTRRTVGLLLVEPVAANALLWTNDAHGLFLSFVPATDDAVATSAFGQMAFTGIVATDPGVVFWIHGLYVWGMALASLLVVCWWIIRRKALYRGQFALLAVGIAVPLVGSLVDNVGMLSVRLSEPAFVVTGVALTLAVVEFDFVDVTPIAHSTVLDEMGNAVFVLDRDDTLVEVNRRGRELLGIDARAIGTDAEILLTDMPDVYERYADVREGTDTVVVETPDGARHFEVEVTPLFDARDRFVGRVFLVRDVTDQRERQEELRRQNEHLEQFASLVSHDLRNPLEVAHGHVELAMEHDDDAAYLQKVAESHDRMWAIIDDVLTLTRESQPISQTEVVDLETLVADAWSNVETGNATLQSDVHGVVDGDRDRLLRALANLFRNAVEHGPDDVTVRVGMLETDVEGGLVDLARQGFFVEDDGPGIPADDREAVFETGYTDSDSGTGLGLSIVRNVVEAHGWEITATGGRDGGVADEGVNQRPDRATALSVRASR